MATLSINPVALIKREMANRKITILEMANSLDRDPGTMRFMIKKDNMSVERLVACSKALKYNFFLEIGYSLPYSGPVDKKAVAELGVKDRKIATLEKALKEADLKRQMLETEVNTVKAILKDFVAARQV